MAYIFLDESDDLGFNFEKKGNADNISSRINANTSKYSKERLDRFDQWIKNLSREEILGLNDDEFLKALEKYQKSEGNMFQNANHQRPENI